MFTLYVYCVYVCLTLYNCVTLVLDCGAAESVDNSSVTTQSGTTFGAMAMYVCNVGYHIDSGDTERYCEGSGFWNGTLLTCLIDGK